jgi:sugar lactone lactonase YvrE
VLEQISSAWTQHGEGPIWDQGTGRLLFVDLLKGDLLSMATDRADPERLHVGSVAACVAPRREGGFVVATERGFSLIDDSGTISELPELWSDSGVRMNDGACDPSGRFFAGSMAYDEGPGQGALWCLEPSLEANVALKGVSISNGLGWSPDGTIAFYVDSLTQRIDAMDYDPVSGSLSDRRPHVTIPAELGMPDGLTIDSAGGIWVALWGGGAVHRYELNGTLDLVAELPTSHPTSCTFGGANLDELFVTTSTLGGVNEDTGAGALFWMKTDLQGIPCPTFFG